LVGGNKVILKRGRVIEPKARITMGSESKRLAGKSHVWVRRVEESKESDGREEQMIEMVGQGTGLLALAGGRLGTLRRSEMVAT
jgi:hypothetical protein